MRRVIVIAILLIAVLAGTLWWMKARDRSTLPVLPSATPGEGSSVATSTGAQEGAQVAVFPPAPPVAVPPRRPEPIKVDKKPLEPKAKEAQPPTSPMVPPSMVPPPVVIHKELIPKNIEILRVYYERNITAPGTTIEFDINGTGFTAEFEKMIWVESGSPEVDVRDLALITPNQIHGFLVVRRTAKTAVAFPQVLISGKVVFRAPDPFAVIRPGEVLNLVFTEMGESGRTGRFRVFTNLTEQMYAKFLVVPSTPAIQVAGLTPMLPFIVDGTVNVGAAEGGGYGLQVKLGDKLLWEREGIIRIIPPNVGQSGLIQRIQATDGFHRPGDRAKFLIQGSGFQPQDPALLTASVPGWETINATFTFVAPGRMELHVDVPLTAATTSYSLSVLHGDSVLHQVPQAFTVVQPNWTRGVRLEPALYPGSAGVVILNGRDLQKDFIDSIEVQVDDPELVLGKFTWVSPEEARAPISIGQHVVPGDYLLALTSNGKPVQPQFGSIIRIGAKK